MEADSIVVLAAGTIDAPDPFPGQMPWAGELRVRPFIPKNTSTVYASIKPTITVATPEYLKVFGAIADFLGADVFDKPRRANKSEMAILFPVKIVQRVPDFGGLEARVEGRRIIIRPDLIGIYGEARVSSFWLGPPMDLTPKVLEGFPIRDRFLRLTLNWQIRLFIDPTYRIRYRIRRGSDGTEVSSGMVWSASDQPFGGPVDLWEESNYLETAFNVELVAERPPGTEVARHTQSVAILDLFDRSHPFVRWRKKHFFSDGAPITNRLLMRISAVHRTAIRERCKFCDVGTLRDRSTYVVEALDAVPTSEEEDFSTRLCPYCFPGN